MDIEKFLKDSKIVIIGSNFYINQPDLLFDDVFEPLDFIKNRKHTREDAEKETVELVTYIKSKLDVPIPDKIIRSIIELEIEFYLNQDKLDGQSI